MCDQASSVLDDSVPLNALHHNQRFAAPHQAPLQESRQPKHLEPSPPGQVVLRRAGSIRVEQALQLGGAMIVPPTVMSNPAYPSKATPVSDANSDRQLRHQPRLSASNAHHRHEKETMIPKPPYSNS